LEYFILFCLAKLFFFIGSFSLAYFSAPTIDLSPLVPVGPERDVLLLLQETAVSKFAFDFLSCEPSHLARQLFCVDFCLMQDILPGDLHSISWIGEGEAARIEAAVRLTNNLTYFLVAQVVSQTNVKERAHAAAHIVNLGYELLAVQNFNSLLSVFLFFKNRSIMQLDKCTLSRFDKRTKERLSEILMVMDPLNNFFNYRACFDALLPPKICCLEVALKDLLFEAESAPNHLAQYLNEQQMAGQKRHSRQMQPWDQQKAAEDAIGNHHNSNSSPAPSSGLSSPYSSSDPADPPSPQVEKSSSTSSPPSARGPSKSVSFSINPVAKATAKNESEKEKEKNQQTKELENKSELNASPSEPAASVIYNIGKLIKMGLLIDQITLRHVQHDFERDEPLLKALHNHLCASTVHYDPDKLHQQSSLLLSAALIVVKSNSSNGLILEKDSVASAGSHSANNSRNNSPANSSHNLIVKQHQQLQSNNNGNSNTNSLREDFPLRSNSTHGIGDLANSDPIKENKELDSQPNIIVVDESATTIANDTIAQSDSGSSSVSCERFSQHSSKATRSPIKRIPIAAHTANTTSDQLTCGSETPDAMSISTPSSQSNSLSCAPSPVPSSRPRTKSNPHIVTRPRTFSESALAEKDSMVG
jgi:hypothetical protein